MSSHGQRTAAAGMSPYEDLAAYFPELTNPDYANTLRIFFDPKRVTLDGQWCSFQEPRAMPQSKEGYSQLFQFVSSFTNDLLNVFRLSPICKTCPGQDSRTTYAKHVCGAQHFKFVYQKLEAMIRSSPSLPTDDHRNHFWQSWIFVLGEVSINYLTGELLVRRRPSNIGLSVHRVEELPSEGRLIE